mgnify:CR=1 FL=1
MRKEFSAAIEKLALADESILFITGDLGYNALENLQEKLGRRFINAGVAEQNMVGVAAGMAYKGFKVFCYSIAPFAVYRCLEQFRNDACLHNLPVFLVGNGGGYGYGIMGSTHHAIEDLACLSSLQNVKTWIPAFSDEVEPVLTQIVQEKRPAYMRLGVGPLTPEGAVLSGSLKKIVHAPNAQTAIVALGPIAANVLNRTYPSAATLRYHTGRIAKGEQYFGGGRTRKHWRSGTTTFGKTAGSGHSSAAFSVTCRSGIPQWPLWQSKLSPNPIRVGRS